MKIFIFPLIFLAFIFYLTVQGCASSPAKKDDRKPASVSSKYAPNERNFRTMRETSQR